MVREAEFAVSESDTPPASGWTRRPLPQLSLEEEARARKHHRITVWVRARFDMDQLGSGPHALYTEDIAERYVAYLNGVEVYRTYAGKDDRVIGWNRPVLVPLPAQALRAGPNELLLRVDSALDWFLVVGDIRLAPLAELRPLHARQTLWRVKGAEIANYIVLALTAVTFLLWLSRRRQEPELAWLAALGIAYFIRGTVFFFERAPFDPLLFGLLSQTMIFFLTPLGFGFVGEYFKVPHRERWNVLWFALGAANAIASVVLTALGQEGRICTAIVLATGAVSIGVLVRAPWRGDAFARVLLLTIMAATLAVGVHDLGRQDHLLWWDGAGFYLQPYNAFAILAAFFFVVGRRFVSAVRTVESLNASLEGRIAAARADLAASEAARRRLEVERALESERERLMREVHDGIGSSLVTALAVARKQKHPAETIDLLRRAVADLKLTVDSLDPLGGDILALLGNLRHRWEPDLGRAGLVVRWDVGDCPSIGWLDSANALQFLRLVQEAVANALAHSAAKVLVFACAPETREGRPGVRVAITDNGRGFVRDGEPGSGKGLRTMAARAETIGAVFACASAPGRGTTVEVWLPVDRRRA